MKSNISKILFTGVNGQIGKNLLPKIAKLYGKQSVIATDLYDQFKLAKNYNFSKLDVTNTNELENLVKNEKVDCIIHLAGILSSLSEKDRGLAYRVNVESVNNIFELALKYKFR